ncbi:DUF2478 domain-containing protein [Candidatus Bipolaricaulota bacterium]|nr:DUF2478 domain-containing protein [Candidatus Bipolaricaulota bacterium]
MEEALAYLGKLLQGKAGALIITGPIGSGKTRAATWLSARLRSCGARVGGVISPRVLEGGVTVGYRVRDVSTGEQRPLCSVSPPGMRFGGYYFSPEGIAFANRALSKATAEAQIVVIDEVGPLELSGGGFAPGVLAVRRAGLPLILSVRPGLIDRVSRWLGLPGDAPIVRLTP